jgi:O-antigen/teichoic acid export membrane protein
MRNGGNIKIIENSLIYLLLSIVSKAAPYLLLPFLTSYLEPTEFGKLSIFLVVNSLYVALIGMSMHANITKNFFNKSKFELSIIIGNIFFILIATTIFYLIIILIITLLTKSFFSIPSHYLLIAPIIALFTMINQIYLTILQIQGRAYLFGALEIMNAFLITIITIIMLKLVGFHK